MSKPKLILYLLILGAVVWTLCACPDDVPGDPTPTAQTEEQKEAIKILNTRETGYTAPQVPVIPTAEKGGN